MVVDKSRNKMFKQVAFRWILTRLMDLSGFKLKYPNDLKVEFDGEKYIFSGVMVDEQIVIVDKTKAL